MFEYEFSLTTVREITLTSLSYWNRTDCSIVLCCIADIYQLLSAVTQCNLLHFELKWIKFIATLQLSHAIFTVQWLQCRNSGQHIACMICLQVIQTVGVNTDLFCSIYAYYLTFCSEVPVYLNTTETGTITLFYFLYFILKIKLTNFEILVKKSEPICSQQHTGAQMHGPEMNIMHISFYIFKYAEDLPMVYFYNFFN